MDILIHWDQNLFLYLNNLGCSIYDEFWLYITNSYSWIPAYFIILIIIIEKYGWKRALLIAASIGIMIAITDSTASFVKDSIKRLRPCRNVELNGHFRLVIDTCRGTYCYFSAHAASSFALATYLSSLFYKKHNYVPYLLFLWAGLVAYSRIYVGVHFPLDILTGTLFGLLIGWLFSKTQRYLL